MDLQSSLALIPAEFKSIYRTHWHTINGSKSGILKDVFHFPLITETDDEIESRIRTALSRYQRSIKVNVSFGFILKERTDGNIVHLADNLVGLDEIPSDSPIRKWSQTTLLQFFLVGTVQTTNLPDSPPLNCL